jgi:hypothetical protein
MARPGLEPGTPRFSGTLSALLFSEKDLQVALLVGVGPRDDPVAFGRFGAGSGLRARAEVLMSRVPRQRPQSAIRSQDLRRVRRAGPRPDPSITPLAGSTSALHGVCCVKVGQFGRPWAEVLVLSSSR